MSWVDPLIGKIPHTDLILRNTCSFNLNLLNLTYIHTAGIYPTKIVVIFISLGLLANTLIGLRLLKASASVTLHHGFMAQIIKHGYSNICIIYNQLKNKQLPEATWYAWVITLAMGVTFISPCYASSTGGEIVIDASADGEHPPTSGQGNRGVGEGVGPSRSAEAGRTFGRDVGVGVVSGAAVTAAQQAYTAITTDQSAEPGPSTAPQQPSIELLQAEMAKKDERILSQAETIFDQSKTIKSLEKQLSWFGWFKGCFKTEK